MACAIVTGASGGVGFGLEDWMLAQA